MLSPTVDEDDLIVSHPSLFDALSHFAMIGWKVAFTLIPPAEWGGGWPAFCVALGFIGLITKIVAEVATVLGCTVGLKPAVTAITLVAVGTSLPDTFASMQAAQMYSTADEAIGNVTGSNAVNVFVGLGLPWVISAFYCESQNPPTIYKTPPGSLAFSVMLFLIVSLTCFAILFIRRCTLGGELGGPPATKYLTGVILICLWLIYIIFSILKAYDIIEGIKF
jgi:solute carrier family 8 (sodium/calcium exchanger)